MNLTRIQALVQRNILLTFTGLDPLLDIFYWPLLDITLWGLASTWVAKDLDPALSVVWLTGIVLWAGCVRSNLDVSLNLLNELWSRNVVNLFATPIEISEWICAAMILGAFDTLVTTIYGALLVFLFYGINIFSMGWLFIPFLFLLMISGWSIGFFTAGWLFRRGQQVQKLVWILAWFFLPFSALFYPLSSLPSWAVFVAQMFPMSYAFEGLRLALRTGIFPTSYLVMSIVLNGAFLAFSLRFFVRSFHKSCMQGLARLELE